MHRYFSFLLILATGAALAGSTHVHGVANLDLTIEGGQLTVTLESPLDALVGFERPPRTPKEKETFSALGKTLNDGAALFSPSPDAKCSLKSTTVKLPFADGKASKDGHADVDADYVFQCTNPAALKAVDTALFKSFSRLYRLEVRRVGPSGQGGGQMTPKKPSIAW